MFPIIKITDTLYIPVYLLVISLTYCLLIIWLRLRCHKHNFNLKHSLNIALTIMIGGLVGARLLHVAYEQPNIYLNNPLRVLHIWEGGFVFYGGAIGAFVSSFVYTKINKLGFLKWCDFYTPLLPLGYALGRIACFLNGCCYGVQCSLPWGVHFKTVDPRIEIFRHPTQLYAFSIEMIIFMGIMFLEAKIKNNKINLPTGSLFLFWLMSHSLNRIFMEFFREDFRGNTILGLSLSTCISLVLFSIALIYYIRIKRAKA